MPDVIIRDHVVNTLRLRINDGAFFHAKLAHAVRSFCKKLRQ
jgi:hypothetical protein